MQQNEDFLKALKQAYELILLSFVMVLIVSSILAYLIYDPNLTAFKSEPEKLEPIAIVDEDKIENGIHISTGLIEADGLMTVVKNCTSCHSSKLIIQNRMNAESWNATIKWMQETQNLWDLGENQGVIVNYLVTNYPPVKKGRRENLKNIDWYVLED
jgi:hypothetical protein